MPGLVLAILDPSLEVTMLDGNGKKVRFQRQAVLELGLENVTPVQARVEHFTTRDFDQIVSRAFAQLATFVELTRPLLAEGGEWLAMKGRDAASELAELPPDVTLIERRDLEVPGDAAQRVLLRLRRA